MYINDPACDAKTVAHLLAFDSVQGRFKDNEITSSDIVYNLRPVTFDWKKDGSHDIGLIAEEVGDHMTELISKDQEGNVEGVKYTKLTSLLIKAVQDQQQTINELTTRISNLEN